MPDLPFRENVVVLTGASSGIGRAMALQLAGQGAWLALASRDVAALVEVVQLCIEQGGRAIAVPTDVTSEAQCRALVDCTLGEYGRIDTLVNNAGISMWARFDEMTTLEPFEQIMRVNYLGSVYLTHHALPSLKHMRGRIVAISSLAGRNGVPARSGYVASKHAMTGFFDTLRIELMGSGVSVTVVYPDFVRSENRERYLLGSDGRPIAKNPVQQAKVMSAEQCARIAIRGMARRQREVLMGRGKLGQWLKLVAPQLVDRIALRAIREGK